MPRHVRFDILFEPVRIGPVSAPNRFNQTPHATGFGWQRPQSGAAQRGLKAEGRWSVVCTEYCSIRPSSDDSPPCFPDPLGRQRHFAHRPHGRGNLRHRADPDVQPGVPAMQGGFTSNVDMKTGAPAFGTPEYAKAAQASGQFARRIGVPFRSSNTRAANALDAWAALEPMMSL